MNIKEVAQLTGLSHQAIYKKIKANGIVLETLKDKPTGHFTADGEAKIRDLFGISEKTNTPNATELTTKVAELTTEVEKLRNQVAMMQTRVDELTGERDFLRMTLERSQHLEAAAIAKLPTPPKLLPSGNDTHGGGLRGWFQRRKNRHKSDTPKKADTEPQEAMD